MLRLIGAYLVGCAGWAQDECSTFLYVFVVEGYGYREIVAALDITDVLRLRISGELGEHFESTHSCHAEDAFSVGAHDGVCFHCMVGRRGSWSDVERRWGGVEAMLWK